MRLFASNALFSATAKQGLHHYRLEATRRIGTKCFDLGAIECFVEENDALIRFDGLSPLDIVKNLFSQRNVLFETDHGEEESMELFEEAFAFLRDCKNGRIIDDVLFYKVMRSCYCKRGYQCNLCREKLAR